MSRQARDILLAYLHDPPDKSLSIRDHQQRAREYIQLALGDTVSPAEVKDPSDPLAAVAERFPSPHWQTLSVGPSEDRLTVHHPLSGAARELRCAPWDPRKVSSEIERLVSGVDPTFHRFLLVWRRLKDQLAASCGDWFSALPADTRVPDHTIWNHLDTTAGLKAALAERGVAFLSFSLGPVQSFIAASRTVRDLWSGSMILSWMTFQALLPVVRELGPTALVYPTLRGLPWLDLWLRRELGPELADRIPLPPASRLVSPCLPNRFLALVPWGVDGRLGRTLAEQCRQAALAAWSQIADGVRSELDRKLDGAAPGWDERWDEQVGSFWDVRTALLPWSEVGADDRIGELLAGEGSFERAFPDAAAVRRLAQAIPEDQRPGYAQDSAGGWQAKVELSARLMQAVRSVRHVPPDTVRTSAEQRFAPKCALLGSYEQLGPSDFDQSRGFWQLAASRLRYRGVRLRQREALSAVALTKRFSGPCFFQNELGLSPEAIRYDDTATTAAAFWLQKAGIDPDRERRREAGWSGQWVYWPTQRSGADSASNEPEADEPCPDDPLWAKITAGRKELGPPPAYYAILMLDGDRMGGWLRGDHSPRVRQAMHRDLVAYFESLSNRQGEPDIQAGLDARRPVGPALHAAVSEALSNFALHFVPQIVERHQGQLIYAGGDDVLALLPTSSALQCAVDLRQTFRRDWWTDASGQERLLMGSQATVSAGLAVVHYKEDLQTALQAARDSEKAAKHGGRDALQVAACRRSGERASALCPWEFAETLHRWVEAFLPGPHGEPEATDRWAYRLSSLLPTLRGLPVEAMSAEIRRQVGRIERASQERFEQVGSLKAPDLLASQFTDYLRLLRERDEQVDAGVALENFITLCKTASFLARGRDE